MRATRFRCGACDVSAPHHWHALYLVEPADIPPASIERPVRLRPLRIVDASCAASRCRVCEALRLWVNEGSVAIHPESNPGASCVACGTPLTGRVLTVAIEKGSARDFGTFTLQDAERWGPDGDAGRGEPEISRRARHRHMQRLASGHAYSHRFGGEVRALGLPGLGARVCDECDNVRFERRRGAE